MMAHVSEAIAAVVHHPLFVCGLTVAAYQFALWVYQRTGWIFAQPVLISILLVIGMLIWVGIDYAEYQQGTSMLWLLLGPCTVTLAIPLYTNMGRIRELLWPVVIALSVGGVVTVAVALLLAKWMGASDVLLMTLAPKSVTTPIALLVSEQLGGIASLAAVFVMITGIMGATIAPMLLRLCRVTHPAARGLTYGMTAHAVGTALALQEGEECGAFSALAMSVTGVMTALLLPIIL